MTLLWRIGLHKKEGQPLKIELSYSSRHIIQYKGLIHGLLITIGFHWLPFIRPFPLKPLGGWLFIDISQIGSLASGPWGPCSTSGMRRYCPERFSGSKRKRASENSTGLDASREVGRFGCFQKWWVSPTTMGFPTKNWSFWGVLGVPLFLMKKPIKNPRFIYVQVNTPFGCHGCYGNIWDPLKYWFKMINPHRYVGSIIT